MIRLRSSLFAAALATVLLFAFADNHGPRLTPGESGGPGPLSANAVDELVVAQVGGGVTVDARPTGRHPDLPSGRFGPTLTR